MKINLPIIIAYSDYHDIYFAHETLEQIIPGAKFEELGCSYRYYALFYKGRKPAKAKIEELLAHKGLRLEELE